MDKNAQALESLQSAFDELKTKIGDIDKIAEIETAVIDDQRELAKTATELKEAKDKLEASIEGLPEQWRADIKAHIDTLPDPNKQKDSPAEVWQDMAKMDREDFIKSGSESPILVNAEGQAFRKSFESPVEIREKAINATSGVGAGTLPALLWNAAIVGDPWAAAGAFQMAPSSPNFQTLEVSNVQFAASTTTGAASFDAPVGTLGTAAERKCLTYACRILIPREQEADVSGTLSHVEQMVRLGYGKLRGSLTSAAMSKGALAANKGAIAGTKVASTAAKIIGELLALPTIGDVADYWALEPSWMLTPNDYQTLFTALSTSSGFAMQPGDSVPRFNGWRVHVDNQAQSPTAKSGNTSSAFGAWSAGLIQAQRGRLTLDRYMATVPGAIALYATFRFLPVAVNPGAYGVTVSG